MDTSVRIELRDVTKELGRSTVLDNVSLQLDGGHIVALLGANGAGKTTLLHLLGGLYVPTKGCVLIDGEKLERRRLDLRRRLHYLPDLPKLTREQTALDYVIFATEAYDCFDSDTDAKIIDLLHEFDMVAVAESPSHALSRGQRYKATLIALLAIDPEIWIMDEPFTSGMDPVGLTAMKRHIARARDHGRVVVYSTQLVEIANQFSDKICLLSANQVAAYGTPEELARISHQSNEINEILKQLIGDSVDAGVAESD